MDNTVTESVKKDIQPTFNGAIKATNGQFISPTKQGTQPRKNYYQKTEKHFPKVLKTLLRGMKSNNEMIRIQSASKLLDKIIPNIKVQDSEARNGVKNYQIIIGNGYIPKQTGLNITAIEATEDTEAK